MVVTKSRKKKPLTLDQTKRKELAELTKKYTRERILIKQKYKLKKEFGNFHILVFDCQKKIHFNFQNSDYFCIYKNYLSPTKEVVKKLLELFPPIETYFCPTKGNKGFHHEGDKALNDGRVIEEIYPILIKSKDNDSNITINWETKEYSISIEFSSYKTNFKYLINKSPSEHGMNSVSYSGGYTISYWPLQSEFDITEYINESSN